MGRKETSISRKPREFQIRIPKRPIPRLLIIKMPKVKDKERVLTVAREKPTVIYKEILIKTIRRCFSRNV